MWSEAIIKMMICTKIARLMVTIRVKIMRNAFIGITPLFSYHNYTKIPDDWQLFFA